MNRSLTEIVRQSPEVALAGLANDNQSQSLEAAGKLVAQAGDFGLSLKDYLTIAINPSLSETPARFSNGDGLLNGFEAALLELNLPFRDNFADGVLLQAASDSFQKYPGTRALFPEVVDQMLKWKNRQDQIESVEPMVAQSRTINGSEMISTAVEDDSKDRGTYSIAEFGNIPVRTIRTSQQSVGIFKHGSGIRTSYEFNRRVSLDTLTPYAARVERELQISKVGAATSILVNGDGVNGAAPVVAFTTFGGVVIGTTPLEQQYKAFAKWLVTQAKNGTPIDTVVGNLDIYLSLLFMFTPTVGNTSVAEAISAKGGPAINVSIPLLNNAVKFVLSSSAPANKIIGYSRGDTLEELVESGSSISENERSIKNQSVIYVRTENTGYKLVYGDTRSILNLAA